MKEYLNDFVRKLYNQFKFLIKLHQMKFVIAATFAAAASANLAEDIANEFTCAAWKTGVAINKPLTAE